MSMLRPPRWFMPPWQRAQLASKMGFDFLLIELDGVAGSGAVWARTAVGWRRAIAVRAIAMTAGAASERAASGVRGEIGIVSLNVAQ